MEAVAFFASCLAVAILLFALLMLIYLAISVRLFSAEFVYMKLEFGKPVYWDGQPDGVKKGGGLGIVWAFRESVYAVPTINDSIDLDKQIITTKAKRTAMGDFSAVNDVQVDAVFYFNWPNEFESIKRTYLSAPPSGLYPDGIKKDERERLKQFVSKSLKGAIGIVLENASWFELKSREILDRKTSLGSHKINDLISEEVCLNKSGPVAKAGWEDIRVEISDIILPSGFGEAMSMPEVASYEADARKKLTDAIVYEKTKVMEAIKRLGDTGSLVHAWDKLGEAAQGSSNTILLMPTSLNKFIEQKTGIELNDREMISFVDNIKKVFREV